MSRTRSNESQTPQTTETQTEPVLPPEPHQTPEPETSAPKPLNVSSAQVPESVSLELERMSRLLTTNLNLVVTKVEQQSNALQQNWKSAEEVLKKMEAVISLLEDFLAGLDEQTDRLVTVAAALIRAMEATAEDQTTETMQ